MRSTFYFTWSYWKHINYSTLEAEDTPAHICKAFFECQGEHFDILLLQQRGIGAYVTWDNFPFNQTLISSALIKILHLTQRCSLESTSSQYLGHLSHQQEQAWECDIGKIITSRGNNNTPLNWSGWVSYSTCSFSEAGLFLEKTWCCLLWVFFHLLVLSQWPGNPIFINAHL